MVILRKRKRLSYVKLSTIGKEENSNNNNMQTSTSQSEYYSNFSDSKHFPKKRKIRRIKRDKNRIIQNNDPYIQNIDNPEIKKSNQNIKNLTIKLNTKKLKKKHIHLTPTSLSPSSPLSSSSPSLSISTPPSPTSSFIFFEGKNEKYQYEEDCTDFNQNIKPLNEKNFLPILEKQQQKQNQNNNSKSHGFTTLSSVQIQKLFLINPIKNIEDKKEGEDENEFENEYKSSCMFYNCFSPISNYSNSPSPIHLYFEDQTESKNNENENNESESESESESENDNKENNKINESKIENEITIVEENNESKLIKNNNRKYDQFLNYNFQDFFNCSLLCQDDDIKEKKKIETDTSCYIDHK